MKIKKQELLNALDTVKPGLASKEMIEQSTHFAFREDGLIAFNDEIFVFYPLETEIRGAIRAEELHKLISKIKGQGEDQEIEITAEDEEIIIKGNRAKAGMKVQTEIKLPLEEIDFTEEDKWRKIPKSKTLFKAMNICSKVAAVDMSRPVYTCVYIDREFVMGTDSLHLSRYALPKEFTKCFKKKDKFLVDAKAVSHLLKQKATHFQTDGTWIHFRNEAGVVFSCRLFSGEFPTKGIHDLIEKQEGEDFTEVKFPENLGDILERTGIFTKTDFKNDEYLTLTLEGKRMTLKGKGEYGWFEEVVRRKESVEEKVEFMINPNNLLDAMGISATGFLRDRAITFKGEDGNLIHLIARTLDDGKK